MRRLYEDHREDHRQYLFRQAIEVLHDREQAEEAVQRTFVSVIKNLHKFNNLPANETTALLVIMAKNKAIDQYRKNKNRNDMEIPLESYQEFWEESVEDRAVRADLLDHMRRALGKIPDIYADALMLHLYYGYPHAEIGRMLGISAGASRWRVCKGKKLIGQILREEEWVDERKPEKFESTDA